MIRSLIPIIGLVALAGAVAGCSAKEAVSVSGSIGNVSLRVQQGALASRLQGSFDVSVSLGERASDGTDVLFSSFTIVKAEDGSSVLTKEHLSVRTTTPLPVHLEAGDSKTVHFEVGTDSQGKIVPMEISAKDVASLCAQQVRIVAEMTDSATGEHGTSIRSSAFVPSGCK